MKGRVSQSLPRPARILAGNMFRYVQRLCRWAMILGQVRGVGWRNQLKLLASAGAAPLTSLRNLSGWQDPVLLFDAEVRVRDVGAFQVRRRSDDLWHVLPWREQAIHRVLRQLLRPGDWFIDGGANIGVYTLLAARLVGPSGRVIAIEMMPDTAAILRRHVGNSGCGNIEIIEKALSDRGNDSVTARVPLGKFGQASIARTDAGPVPQEFEEREVRTITLDEVCRGIEHIRLMKLDLEGAELTALAGARSTLQRTESVIYESHTDSDALAEAFKSAGFDVSRTLGKDRLAQRLPATR